VHYPCMIVGPDPDRQLEPLSDHLSVPRYRCFLEASEVALMAEHFSLPSTDLSALAAKMPEWAEAEGGVEDGRVFRWSTDNPNGKYDWYAIGGRFSGSLRLKQPVPRRWLRFLGVPPKERVDQARKAEIQHEQLLADPPTALLLDGAWYECPFTSDQAEVAKWRRQFADLFATIPDESLLTIVDLHS